MGPLEMLYSWQALLCAAACVGVTQLVKAIIDTIYERKWAKMDEAAKKKAEEIHAKAMKPKKGGTLARKQSFVVTRFVLPITPILVGFIYANVVPFRPEVLIEFVSEHVDGGWVWTAMGWGAWGAACGQFSTFLYDRLKKTLESVAQRSAAA